MERVLYRISSWWLCRLQGTGHAFADVTVSTVRQLKDSDSLNVDLNTSKHHTTCKFLDPTPDQNISGGMQESAFWFLHLAILTRFGKYHLGGDAGPARRVCLAVTATPVEQPWQAHVSLRQFCGSFLTHRQACSWVQTVSRAFGAGLCWGFLTLSATRLPVTHKWTETCHHLLPLLHFFFFSIL